MGKSNKKVKDALIRLYGNKCFIERLHLRDTKGMKYKGCNQYKKMKQLTYHHIKMKSQGGKATIENGALLSAENHEWFHKQSKQDQEIMNNMFQELKREIDHKRVGVELVEDLDCPFEINCDEIWIEDNRIHTKTATKKELEERIARKEKKEFQRIRRELEDR